MSTRSLPGLRPGLAITLATVALASCGGGESSGDSPGDGPGPIGAQPTATAATAGVWKGTITSSGSGQSNLLVGMVEADGHSVWMTTDGHVFEGPMPVAGTQFESHLAAHADDDYPFHDGTHHGAVTMMVDDHSLDGMRGRHDGVGDSGTFSVTRSATWTRPASLAEVAGVYTRTTSSGYAMTLTIGSNGQMHASDTRGCAMAGEALIPDQAHNMYRIHATVTSCGDLDGTYHGTGALLDADAMKDWMSAMHPIEHGDHMAGGSRMHDHNTVPGGHHNLFMFSMASEHGAIMDALAR